MKINIRSNVFETNSSSMHSIVINNNKNEYFTKDEIMNDLEYFIYNSKNNPKELYISSSIVSDFERDFKICYSFRHKLSYVLAEFQEECIDEITAILKEFYDFDKIKLDSMDIKIKYYDDVTNKKVKPEKVFLNPSNNKLYYKVKRKKRLVYENIYPVNRYGNIDHQSVGTLRNFIKEHNISLREFLMNKRYVIIVDSDETHIFDKLYESGLINMNGLEGPAVEKRRNEDED